MLQKPYKGDENYIFISYSHLDIDEVLGFIETLQKNGYNVWYDEGIDPGTEWDENIAKHIRGCSYFISYITENYVSSQNCKDELTYARDLDKERLLIYGTTVELPEGMKMRMNRLQAIYKYKYDDNHEFYQKVFQTDGLELCRTGNKPVNKDIPITVIDSSHKKGTHKKLLIIVASIAVVIIGACIFFLGNNGGSTEVTSSSSDQLSNDVIDMQLDSAVAEDISKKTEEELVGVYSEEMGDDGATTFSVTLPDGTNLAKGQRYHIKGISCTDYDVATEKNSNKKAGAIITKLDSGVYVYLLYFDEVDQNTPRYSKGDTVDVYAYYGGKLGLIHEVGDYNIGDMNCFYTEDSLE